jgi:hypothetical protein
MSSIPLEELLPFVAGLGAARLPGVLEDEGDPMLLQQAVSTTKPGTTVFSRVVAAPVERKVELTSAVEELEFLVADPRVPNEALLQRLRAARRALMGSARWSYASYADQRERWGAHDELVARLDDVQRAVEARLGYRLTGRAALMDI